MKLLTENYLKQTQRWPQEGRHIMAQYDAESIVVYQAYRPEIGNFASENNYLGGAFSLGRMSWIKPNFLWMMYRSGWGTKEGQEIILAVRIKGTGFDTILSQAVASTYWDHLYSSHEEWQRAGKASDVRLQWDPDHGPQGDKLDRRAIQLGLRGKTLANYARDWVINIEDISDYVADQRELVKRGALDQLETPKEEIYPVSEENASKIGLIHLQ